MATLTTNYDLIKPGVNDPTDQDLWGGYLNTDLDDIDSLLKIGIDTITSVQTSNYTIVDADRNKVFLANATGGAFNITLPSAAVVGDGFNVTIKKTDSSANAVTIVGTIDGVSNYSLDIENDAVHLVCDGSVFFVVSKAEGDDFFASNAESNTGTAVDKALTPANFGTQQTKAAKGYQKLPGGLILQWGEVTIPPEPATVTETFSIPFPTTLYNISMSSQIANTGGADDNHNFGQVYGDPTLSQFEIKNQYISGGNVSIVVRWIALGD